MSMEEIAKARMAPPRPRRPPPRTTLTKMLRNTEVPTFTDAPPPPPQLRISGVNTSPGWVTGYVPTTDQWNAAYVDKVDAQNGFATDLTLTDSVVIGSLTLARDPAQPLEATSKQYVDAATALNLPKTGGTMSGPLVLAADPTAALQPTSKQYVDAAISTLVSGLTYKGSWNAATNTPTLTSGVGTQGDVWIVGTAGTTTLDGNSVWSVADEALFSGGVWKRIPLSSAYGTMAVQNASAVAITGGTATLSTVGIVGGATIFAPVGTTDDAYFSDVDGGVWAKFLTSTAGWQLKVPLTAPTGTFTTLNASAITGGGTALSTVGIVGGATIVAPVGPDDAYFSDVDGGVWAKFLTSTAGWQLNLPLTAPTGTFTTLNVASFSPVTLPLKIGSTLDTTIYATSTPYSTQPLVVFLDPDGAVMNRVDPTTGEWAHQKATGIPAALINAGRYRTRLTAKPITWFTTVVNSTANTTYAAIFTTEGQPSSVRFIVPSAQSAATIQMAYAFADTVGDGINPTIGGKAAQWTTVTWLNAGLDVDYISQLAAFNLANLVAPTTFALPTADPINYGTFNPRQIFHHYLSDWMPGVAPLRVDGGSGASLVFVRLYVTTGTLQLAVNTGDVSGAYDSFLFGRTLQSFSQVTDGVTTPANFTSTTRVGNWACHGLQYESLNRGIAIMDGGDSTSAGTGSDYGIWGVWRKVAMALSTPANPVELAIFAQPASDFYTYVVQYGQSVDWVKPTVAYLQAWSRNSWKLTTLVTGVPASNGHSDVLQILIGGTITPGNIVSTTITDTNVAGSPLTVSYTVQAGDTLSSVATNFAAAIQATTVLFNAGYRAFSNGLWTNVAFPSVLPSGGTATANGTLTATGYFDYLYITQQIADMSLSAAMSIFGRVESYGGVSFIATLYGDIGMTLQTDATRQKVNAAIRAMSRAVVIDYDSVLSGATGPAGAPQIPSPSLSADGVHPNNAGYVIEANLLSPLLKQVYGL